MMLIRWRIALIPTFSNLSSFPHADHCSGITHCTVKCLHDRRSRIILGILLVIRIVHRGLSAGIKDLWELSEPYEHLSTNMTHIPSADPHHTEQRVDLHTVWERIQKGSAAYTCYVVISKTLPCPTSALAPSARSPSRDPSSSRHYSLLHRT